GGRGSGRCGAGHPVGGCGAAAGAGGHDSRRPVAPAARRAPRGRSLNGARGLAPRGAMHDCCGPFPKPMPMPVLTDAERELAELLVESLNLDGVAAADIDPEAPLFNAGLGLDSIDALELALAISKRYGFQLRSDSD